MGQLILVPCHAVWSLAGDPTQDETWFLRPFQSGEARVFVEHARRGVEAAAAAADAVLMFSGGATERAAGPVSEALGYYRVAEHCRWWGHSEVRERTVVEEYALDSQQNLEYGLHRFREVKGEWPEEVTVGGWGFKFERYVEHARALGWTGRLRSLSSGEPAELEKALAGEARTRAQFAADPWGQRGELAEKREARNPFRRVAPYDVMNQGWRLAQAVEIW